MTKSKVGVFGPIQGSALGQDIGPFVTWDTLMAWHPPNRDGIVVHIEQPSELINHDRESLSRAWIGASAS
jgi:hypothetical protein